MSLPAASLTASGQPATATARPRPPLEEMEGGWTLLLYTVAGGLQSRKREHPASSLLLCFVPHAAIAHTHTHTHTGFLFRRQFVHASPTIGLEPRQSLPERRSSLTLVLARFSHTLPHTHTDPRAQRPKAQGPFPGCRLSLTVVPYCIASSPGVQPCRPAQGRAISPLETFPFLLGASSSAANGPVPGHQMQTAGLEQTKLKQTRPSIRWTDWSPPVLLFDPLSGFDTSPLIWLFFDYWL